LLCSLVALFHSIPVRCCRSWLNVFVQPLLYAACIMPAPLTAVEYSVQRRIILVAGIFWMTLICFANQANAEMSHRREFLNKEKYRDGYVREKVLRFNLEHSSQMASERSSGQGLGRGITPSSASDGSNGCGTNISSLVFGAAANIGDSDCSLQDVLSNMSCLGKSEKWLIDSRCLTLFPNRFVGRGGFAVTVVGTMGGREVVVKVPLASDIVARMNSIATELRFLRSLRHPGIVAFHGACIDEGAGELVLVEEFIRGASLARVVRVPPGGPVVELRYRIFVDICAAVNYLHQHKPVIVHGDLTPRNVLIEKSTLRPKLIDFGLSRRYGKQDKMRGGTVGWIAPEVLAAGGRVNSDMAGAPADPSVDIFSIGALAFFIATGHCPFAGFSLRELVERARRGRLPDLQWPNAEVCWLRQWEELSKRCMSCDAAARPSIAAINTEIEAWLPESPLLPSNEQAASCSWLAALPEIRLAVGRPNHPQPGLADARCALEERGRRIPEHRTSL